MKTLNFVTLSTLSLLTASVLFAQGNQPGYGSRETTGTTSGQGDPNRKGGTITSNTGNAGTANTPLGTDPTFTPANRNPYNDGNFRPGTPGTSANGGTPNTNDARFTSGNPSTLGVAQPAQNSNTNNPTPGFGASTGQSRTGAVGGAPSGNPGPVGSPGVQNTAPTTGRVGTGGSGQGGSPGTISNSGTRGVNGSGF